MRRCVLLASILIACVVPAQVSPGQPTRARPLHVFGAGAVDKVVARTNDPITDGGAGWETHSTTASQIPGAVISFSTPQGQPGFLLMRFSASEWCQGPPSHHCSVIIRGNGQEAYPRAGGNARFDSGLAENQESHSIERMLGPFPGGTTVLVRVMARTSSSALSFRVNEWALVVEHVRTS